MDSSFQDLDILTSRIRDPFSKRYFLEAVRSYKAGALRSSLSATWVAVVYDLIAKYRELSGMGDGAAALFIQKWDQATANNNVSGLLELEKKILEDATQNTQVLSQLAGRQLQRLKEDRHLCAHPAFSDEAALFEPTPELARLHLVNAINLVLSQKPLQGKAVLDQFSADVQSPGFPMDGARIPDYVEQRYIQHIRPQNIKNLGVVLAKALLNGTPAEWQPFRPKVTMSLAALRDRARDSWDDVATSTIQMLNGMPPEGRSQAIAFIAQFPGFWERIDEPVRTALQQTAANIQPEALTDFNILLAVTSPVFRQSILRLIGELSPAQVMEALRLAPLDDLWNPALEAYKNSRAYRASEINFRDFILPFAGKMTSARYEELFKAILENSQNRDAAATPSFLAALLQNSQVRDFPEPSVREEFVRSLQRRLSEGAFSKVIELLASDGWVAPHREEDGEPPLF